MHTLRLLEDHLAPGARSTLPAQNRVLYVRDGEIGAAAAGDGHTVTVDAGAAWHGTTECVVTSGAASATVLRFELLGEGLPAGRSPREARTLLAHPIALDPAQAYLMRCDRVEFAPGGEALPHGHRGGGIRCLLAGELEVRVGGQPGRLMKPGDAWFESGREPVHAIASTREPTAFVRVSILPRAIRGQSSIVYVDPAHAAIKPRKYTVYVDEPIELP
jgi:quercetin dioxygenase-like cupin family protein